MAKTSKISCFMKRKKYTLSLNDFLTFVNNVLFGVNERRKIYVSPKLQITKPLVFQLSMLRPHQRAWIYSCLPKRFQREMFSAWNSMYVFIVFKVKITRCKFFTCKLFKENPQTRMPMFTKEKNTNKRNFCFMYRRFTHRLALWWDYTFSNWAFWDQTFYEIILKLVRNHFHPYVLWCNPKLLPFLSRVANIGIR